MILASTVLDKFDPKPSDAAFSTVFFRDSFQRETGSDVISGVAMEHVGVDAV